MLRDGSHETRWAVLIDLFSEHLRHNGTSPTQYTSHCTWYNEDGQGQLNAHGLAHGTLVPRDILQTWSKEHPSTPLCLDPYILLPQLAAQHLADHRLGKFSAELDETRNPVGGHVLAAEG